MSIEHLPPTTMEIPDTPEEAPTCLICHSRNVYVLSDRTVVCRRCGGRTRNGEGVDG